MSDPAFQRFAEWILRVGTTDFPDEDIQAINVGLFQTPEGFDAYLSGARTYTADDDDWACTDEYSPSERYFIVGMGDQTWEEVQSKVAGMVRTFAHRDEFKTSILANRIVTVGFDDGNLERVL